MREPKTPLPWTMETWARGKLYIVTNADDCVMRSSADGTDDEAMLIENAAYAVHAANALPEVLAALREAESVLKALGDMKVIGADHLAVARVAAARGCIAFALAKAEGAPEGDRD